jgi:hypothetical protein
MTIVIATLWRQLPHPDGFAESKLSQTDVSVAMVLTFSTGFGGKVGSWIVSRMSLRKRKSAVSGVT